jgi:hypothetical protein
MLSTHTGLRVAGWGLLVGLGLLALGCDQVDPTPSGVPPQVTAFEVAPDTVRGPASADTATVSVDIAARIRDPDGTVERVVFTLEPASNPRATIPGALPPQGGGVYGQRIGLTLPVVEEVYSVRVFAVDDDSLASNQALGQFRFVPTP